MHFTTTVRVALDDGTTLSGLKVCLFDRDVVSSDDLLGTGTTDAAGEARFSFNSEDFADLDETVGGSFPDLYAVVYDVSGEKVASTRAEATDNYVPKYIDVRIARDVAQSRQLVAG